jgi:hypothetical protein
MRHMEDCGNAHLCTYAQDILFTAMWCLTLIPPIVNVAAEQNPQQLEQAEDLLR